MGNDRRRNIIHQHREAQQQKPDALKEKLEFLDEIKKLITDWAKTFPNDTGTIHSLNKFYKKVEFDGISKTLKNTFYDFMNKFRQKVNN
jgi:hypothetical protein